MKNLEVAHLNSLHIRITSYISASGILVNLNIQSFEEYSDNVCLNLGIY